MTEVTIQIIADFNDVDCASNAHKKLKSSAKSNDYELNKTLNDLYPFDNFKSYKQFEIHIEDISKKKNKLSIVAYTGRTDPVTWFSEPLHKLGAKKIYIRENWDEGGCNYYFVDGVKVSKGKYNDEEPKPLTKKDLQINKNLFLPEGRIDIEASLVSHWFSDDIYGSVYMEFISSNGDRFYHKGTGQLTSMVNHTHSNKCEFVASFERGKLKGEYVSFAKRPSKIFFEPDESIPEEKRPCHCRSGKRFENCHGLKI